MPGETPDPQETPEAPAGSAPDGVATLTLSADAVRNSPEYRTLQRQLREAARAEGRAKQEAADARTEAETARQAAEAQRQDALAEQLAAILGEEGVEAFNEVADLSASDPVEAARKLKGLAARFAQSNGQTPAPAGTEQAAPNGGETVTEQQTPPPPRSNLSGDAPLGQPTTGIDWDQVAKDSSDRYAEIVKRNQDPITRARVTDRERGEGFMSWLAASYVKGMKTLGRLPKA